MLKKTAKRVSLFIILLLSIVIVGLGYFLFSNNAPITSGQVKRDIEYKPGLALDIYTPTKQVYQKSPVVVYIHGGAWIGGLKEALNFNRFNQAANALRDSGYTIVSIDYTLAEQGRSPFPACITDASDAVTWVYEHADSFGWDKHNVGLFGESAGAHIAMMVAYANSKEFASTYKPHHFNYVLDVYGPTELEGIYHTPIADSLYSYISTLPASIESRLDLAKYIFGFDPKLDSLRAEQIMQTYSPFNYVNSSVPPTLMIHGKQDRIVPVEQSLLLKSKLDSLGVLNELHIVDGADHGFINATIEQKAVIQKWIVDFIVRQYQ